MKKSIIFSILSTLLAGSIFAQYRRPMDIPLYLSGNFGELRNNHFHSGIDLKTQVVNRNVYCVADGYIARIYVSPAGYGKALYVVHPQTGQMSVYGHLNRFMPEIEAYIKEKQYEKESFKVDLYPEKNLFVVKKGEMIAYSGNAGSSGGPHLHFEIRDEKTENILDPLLYLKPFIKDNAAPEIRGIAVYPAAGEGMVNNSATPLKQVVSKVKKGGYTAPRTTIKAWGKIGVAIKAYDRMTGTSNIYGVKRICLYVDAKKVFESNIESYGFDESSMINSLIDFDDWRRNKSFFMKSFVEPGNKLPFYETINSGYITIDQERIYNLRYELTDAYGNTTNYDFRITGQRQNIPPVRKSATCMAWDKENRYATNDFSLVIPAGSLYTGFTPAIRQTPNPNYYSDVYRVTNAYIPFRNKAEMQIRIVQDLLRNKNQYGIVAIVDGKESWLGGTYNKGYIKTGVSETGQQFAVSADSKKPVITPVRPEKWEKEKTIRLKLSDDKSGIASFRGTIDGKFVLFEHDVKSPVYTYKFDPQRLSRGQNHRLVFTATDACGNTAEYRTEVVY